MIRIHVYVEKIVRNVMTGDNQSWHIHIKFIYYLSEPFLRKRHATKKSYWGGQEKNVQKLDAGEPNLYCINVTPRDFVKYSTHVIVTAMLWCGFCWGWCTYCTKGAKFWYRDFHEEIARKCTKQSIIGPVIVMSTSRDIIDVAIYM